MMRTEMGRMLASVAALGVAATAQAQPPAVTPPAKLSWHGDATAPDISGLWVRTDKGTSAGNKEGWLPWPPPLKAPFDVVWKKRVADTAAGTRADDPAQACLPPGMPRFMSGTTGPMLVIQTPGRVMLYRELAPVRRIWLAGPGLPKAADLEGFSNGNAVGHYEGGDLVTEVIGFKDYPIDATGIPHSDDLKIVERFHRVDAKTLTVEITLTDPKAYARPMKTTVTYTALDDPAWSPKEFICTPKTDYHPEAYVR